MEERHSSLAHRPDFEYNQLARIQNLRYEVIVDKTQSFHDALFKIIIIGDSGIGKSCVLKRLMEDDFRDDHDITVGVEFGSNLIMVEDKILKLQVWDTAGQESFRSITKIFYRGAHVVMLSFSIINGMSFENLTDWLREVRTQCSPEVMIFIVGNKSDLDSMREVQLESVLEFKEMNNILYYTETSAKTGKNIEQLFSDCAKFIYLKYKDKMH